jgi:beta-galactosidase
LDATKAEAELAMAPREQLLFDLGWKFVLGDGNDPVKDAGFGFGQSDFSKTGEFAFAEDGFDDSRWRPLDLPHDWAVELPFVHDDAGSGDSLLRSHG